MKTFLIPLFLFLTISTSIFAKNYELIPETLAVEIETVKFVIEAVPGVLEIEDLDQVSGNVSVSSLATLSGLKGEIRIKDPYFDTGLSERNSSVAEALGEEIIIELGNASFDQQSRVALIDSKITINDITNDVKIKARVIPGTFEGEKAVGVKGAAIIKKSDFSIQVGLFGAVGDESIRDEVVVVFGAVFEEE